MTNNTIPVPTAITINDLTNSSNTGVFDLLMQSVNKNLLEQYSNGRITEGDFGDVYSTTLTNTLQLAIQFLLEKDKTQLSNLLIAENIDVAKKQGLLVDQQKEVSRQQAVSFAADRKQKVAQMGLTALIAQKEADAGTTYPASLNSSSIGTMITEAVNSANVS